jgi:hypothetical protein
MFALLEALPIQHFQQLCSLSAHVRGMSRLKEARIAETVAQLAAAKIPRLQLPTGLTKAVADLPHVQRNTIVSRGWS